MFLKSPELFWSPSVGVPQDEWTHIVYTVEKIGSAITIKVYSNGILSGTTTGIVSGGVDNNRNFYIGAEWGNLTAGRILDDVSIYNEALSSAQIQQHYAAGAASHGIAVNQ